MSAIYMGGEIANITGNDNGNTTLAMDAGVIDVAGYLEKVMGEKRRDIISVGVLTFVYVLIFITGISGNICTCIVIARNAYMHTATNYYLFSLAVSDMLTLIFGLPTELYGIWEAYPWRFGESFCIFKSFLSEMTSYASVLTITSFTIERYVAICHPIKAQTLSNLSRAVKIVFLIWVLSCLFALPYPIHTRLFAYVILNGTSIMDSLQCNVPFRWQAGMTYAFQISTFVFFVLPMAIITIMYSLIGAKLRNKEFESKHKSKTKARKAVVRMLIAVVVAFFCQWAPFHAQRLMTSYVPLEMWTPSLIRFQSDLFYVSGVLYFCNSTINPILYNLMSKKFRLAFKRTLCRCCYSSDELLELNGKTKSVYYSDRATGHHLRQGANNITKMSFSDLNGSKNGGMLLKQEMCKEVQYINSGSRSSPRCQFYQSHSTGRLNDFFYDIGHAQSDRRGGLGPQRALGSGYRYIKSPSGSDVSFGDMESDSIIEMKSLSCCSSSTQLNTKLLVPIKGIRVNRGSYV